MTVIANSTERLSAPDGSQGLETSVSFFDEQRAETVHIQPLTHEQNNWYGKFLAQPRMERLQSFTQGQRLFLADSLSGHLKDFIIKKQGPVKTELRLTQIGLLAQGKTYEEIARQTGQPVATVKEQLHNSAETLKNRLSERDLAIMITKSRNYTSPEEEILPDKGDKIKTEPLSLAVQAVHGQNTARTQSTFTKSPAPQPKSLRKPNPVAVNRPPKETLTWYIERTSEAA